MTSSSPLPTTTSGVERTRDLLKRIKEILVYTAPEQQEVALARLVLEEMRDVVASGDEWFAKWLEYRDLDRVSSDAADLAEEVKRGDHWIWIRAEILKEEAAENNALRDTRRGEKKS